MSHKSNSCLMHLHVKLMHNNDYYDTLKYVLLPIKDSSFYYAYNKNTCAQYRLHFEHTSFLQRKYF